MISETEAPFMNTERGDAKLRLVLLVVFFYDLS